MVIEIICFLFPAIFTAFALENLMETKFTLKDYIKIYSLNTLIINLFSMFLLVCFSGSSKLIIYADKGVNLYYTLAYLGLTAVVSAAVIFVESLHFSRIKISVIDSKNQKNTDNKKETEE